MNKKIAVAAGAIAIGVGAWTGASWHTGKRIESESAARLSELNEKLADALPGIEIRVERLDYARGVFDSRARYGIVADDSQDAYNSVPPGVFEIDVRIQHGPFPRAALAQGAFLPKLAHVRGELARTEELTPLFELTRGAAPLWAGMILSYDGSGDFTGGMPALDTVFKGDHLLFSGARIAGSYRHREQAATARLTVDALAVGHPDAKQPRELALAGFALDVDTRIGRFGLSVGDSALAVEKFEVNASRRSLHVALENFGYTARVGEDETALDAGIAYRVGKLSVNGALLGGGEAALRLERLDGRAAKDLSDFYARVAEFLPGGSGASPEDPDALEEAARSLVMRLLSAGPSLRLDPVRWQTGKGTSHVTFDLRLRKPEREQGSFRALLFNAIESAELGVTVSKPMYGDLIEQIALSQGMDAELAARQAETEIDSLVALAALFEVAREEGDNVVMRFRYADGEAELNGEKMPPEQFQNLLVELNLGDEPPDSVLIEGFSVELVTQVLEESGFKYELVQEPYQGPQLIVAPGDSGAKEVLIKLFLCDDGLCDLMALSATYEHESQQPVSLEALNEWNHDIPYTRAYRNGKGQAVLAMDLSAAGGIGEQAAQGMIWGFLDTLPDFAELLEEHAD